MELTSTKIRKHFFIIDDEPARPIKSSKKHHHLSVKSAKAAVASSKQTHGQSSSQQRVRQLQFLRYVHSAQKRLTEHTTPSGTPTGSGPSQSSGPGSTNPATSGSTGTPTITTVVDESNEEDENDDSILGLGRRIRKLSSRTIEFCDSIDELNNKNVSARSNTHSFNSFDSNTTSGLSSNVASKQPSFEVSSAASMYNNYDTAEAGDDLSDYYCRNSSLRKDSSEASDSRSPGNHYNYQQQQQQLNYQRQQQQQKQQTTSNIQYGTSNSFFKTGGHFQQPLNFSTSSGFNAMASMQSGNVRQQAQQSTLDQPPAASSKSNKSSSSSLGETLSNFASSLMGGRLKSKNKSSSLAANHANSTSTTSGPVLMSSHSSSTERPLGVSASAKGNDSTDKDNEAASFDLDEVVFETIGDLRSANRTRQPPRNAFRYF